MSMSLCCYYVIMSTCSHYKRNDIMTFLCRYIASVNPALEMTSSKLLYNSIKSKGVSFPAGSGSILLIAN